LNISVILAHPDKGSFNHAIARTDVDRTLKNGHDAMWHDLYEEKFDPILHYHEIPNDGFLPNDIDIHCKEFLFR
jgi:putative NADPH-quinone reductase